jgi:hypothetical protein
MKTTALALLCALPAWSGVNSGGLTFEHFGERGTTNRALFASRPEGTIRVLTGGALWAGSDQPEPLLAELLETSGLDAIAVGYEDLSARGPDRRALLGSARIPFVSANVKGAGRTHVVRTVGATRVALVGVTKVPAYRKDVALAPGWTIEDPVVALKTLLPVVAKEADVVVLLAVMDRLECADLVKSVPGIHVAMVPAAGGNDPEPLQAGTTWIAESSVGPSTFSRLTLDGDAKQLTAANRLETVALTEADRNRAQALFSKHKAGFDLDRLVSGVAVAPPLESLKETGPLTSLEPGKTQPVVSRRSDGSVEIVVDSIRVVPSLGERAAPANSSWLMVHGIWKNLIPMTNAGGRMLPTAYSVAAAADNLYVVANGRTLSRLDVEASRGEGGLLTGNSITIEKFGSLRQGNLVFPIPSSGVETLELQFYDFRHAALSFPLLSRPASVSRVEDRPLAPLAKNEIIEAGVFRITRGKMEDRPGMGAAVVDLRIRSLASVQVEGARVGIAGDVGDAWKGLRLVADGQWESEPEKNASRPEAPRFLPGALTGWDFVFLIPEKATSLELRWTFPEIGMPDGRVVKPATLSIPLGGKTASGSPCPKCGEQADANDKFCSKCGAKLGK